MKKWTVVLLTALFALSVSFVPVLADDKAKCGTKEHKCTKPCVMSKIATDKKAECVDKDGKKYEGKCADLVLDVVGMTCGGCENKVKTTLNKVDGVILVSNVSHTDKLAELCYNPEKVDAAKLTAAVASLGYEVNVKADKVDGAKTCAEKHANEAEHKCTGHGK